MIVLKEGIVGFLRGENFCIDLVSLLLSDLDFQFNKGWYIQGQSVMFQVGKVQGDFYIKVIFDFVYNIINICRIGILLLVRK